MTYRATLLVSILFLSAPATAELLTLERAVETTLQNSHSLRGSAQAITAAEAMSVAARADRMPRLGFEYSVNVSDDPLDAFAAKLRSRSVTASDFEPGNLNDPDTSSLFGAALVLKYNLYNGGRTDAEVARAARDEDSARAQYSRVVQHAVFNVIRAYYATQAAERGLEIARAAATAAEHHAATTRKLVREERTVKSDALTAEVNRAAFSSMRERAATRLRLAKNALSVAMELTEAGGDFDLSPINMRIDPPPLPGLAALLDRAMTQRSDLQALSARLQAAEAAIRSVRAEQGIHVDLIADAALYQDDPLVNESAWRVRGVLRKDLYTGDRIKGKVGAATARHDAVRYEIEARKQQIRGEVRASYEHLRDAMARIALTQGNVARARENVNLIRDRYGEGRTILIDLLQAERALMDAQNEELSAVESLYTAIAGLSLADGSLDARDPQSYTRVKP